MLSSLDPDTRKWVQDRMNIWENSSETKALKKTLSKEQWDAAKVKRMKGFIIGYKMEHEPSILEKASGVAAVVSAANASSAAET